MSQESVIALSLRLDGQQPEKTIGSLKRELRESQNELNGIVQKFGLTSVEATKAAKRVAELRDTIGDAKALVNGFNPDRKFEALSGAIRGVTGGFAALQGTMALIGVEGEDIQKTLLKVQAALAVSEGVNNILELKDTFTNLGLKIKDSSAFIKINDVATKAAAATQRLFGIEVATTSTSFKVLKTAMIATGIGALVVLLGTAISAMQSFADKASDAAESQKKLNDEAIKFAGIGQKAEMQFIDQQEKIDILNAKKRGATQGEISKIEQNAQNQRILARQRYLDEVKGKGDEEVEAEAALKNDKFKLKEQQLQADVTAYEKSEQTRKAANEKLKASLKERTEAERASDNDLRKIRQENALAEISDEDKRARQRLIFDFANAQEEIKSKKISEALKLRLIIEERKKSAQALQDLEENIAQQTAQKEQARIEAQQTKVSSIGSGLTISGTLTNEQVEERANIAKRLYDLSKSSQDLELQSLTEKYTHEQELFIGNEEMLLSLKTEYESRKLEITRRFREQELQAETQLQEAKFNAAQAGLQLIGSLAGDNEEIANVMFAIQKGLEIARIISTTAGAIATVQAGVAAVPAILPPGIPNPAFAAASAIGIKKVAGLKLGAVAGIASIAAASVSKFKNGGGAGGIGGPAGAPIGGGESFAAPLKPQGTGTDIPQQMIDALQNGAIKVYVTEGDNEASSKRIRRINRAAKLG